MQIRCLNKDEVAPVLDFLLFGEEPDEIGPIIELIIHNAIYWDEVQVMNNLFVSYYISKRNRDANEDCARSCLPQLCGRYAVKFLELNSDFIIHLFKFVRSDIDCLDDDLFTIIEDYTQYAWPR